MNLRRHPFLTEFLHWGIKLKKRNKLKRMVTNRLASCLGRDTQYRRERLQIDPPSHKPQKGSTRKAQRPDHRPSLAGRPRLQDADQHGCRGND